jgi:hypothetical protein
MLSKLDTSKWRNDVRRRDLVMLVSPRLEFVKRETIVGNLFSGDPPNHTIGPIDTGAPVTVIARTTHYNNDVNIVILPDGRTGWLFTSETSEDGT